MKKKYSLILTLFILICIVTLMMACSASNRNFTGQNPGGINQPARFVPGGTPGTTAVPINPMNSPLGFDMLRTDNLLKQMGSIDGASNINAIVNGNTALVSYKQTGAMTAQYANRTKDAIAARIRQMDNTIKSVVVSEKPDVAAKVKQLSDEIKSGKVGSDIADRFNRLVQSISPQGMPTR